MMLTTRRSRRIDASEGKLEEPALPSSPFASTAVSKRRPVQEETIADESLVHGLLSYVRPILEPAHRHARGAAVRLNPLRPAALLVGRRPLGDVSPNSVLGTWPCQLLVARDLAIVDEVEVVPVGGADVDREEAEGRGHVEVRDFTRPVAGEGGVHCHKHGVVVVEYALHEVQVVPERPAEVGAAIGVACQLEGRVAALQRMHAEERERVRDVQASASRRRAAGVVAAGSPVGVGGGRG